MRVGAHPNARRSLGTATLESLFSLASDVRRGQGLENGAKTVNENEKNYMHCDNTNMLSSTNVVGSKCEVK